MKVWCPLVVIIGACATSCSRPAQSHVFRLPNIAQQAAKHPIQLPTGDSMTVRLLPGDFQAEWSTRSQFECQVRATDSLAPNGSGILTPSGAYVDVMESTIPKSGTSVQRQRVMDALFRGSDRAGVSCLERSGSSWRLVLDEKESVSLYGVDSSGWIIIMIAEWKPGNVRGRQDAIETLQLIAHTAKRR